LESSLNVLLGLLGWAPALGLVWWLRTTSRVVVEPYGLYSGRRIGGVIIGALVLWTGLIPASAFLLGRLEVALGLSVLVYGSWMLLFVGQRRLRGRLSLEAWTDPVIDRARLHVEFVPIGGLWCGAFVLGAFADETHRVQWIQMLVGAAALTAFGVYASVLTNGLRETLVVRLLVFVLWAALLGLVVVSFSPATRFVALAAGVLLATWMAERVRRRTLSMRSQALMELGRAADLRARYEGAGLGAS
jgi:hypothetical protein